MPVSRVLAAYCAKPSHSTLDTKEGYKTLVNTILLTILLLCADLTTTKCYR